MGTRALSEGFMSIWSALMLLALSIGGTMIMRKFHNSMAVGFFMGGVVAMAQLFFFLSMMWVVIFVWRWRNQFCLCDGVPNVSFCSPASLKQLNTISLSIPSLNIDILDMVKIRWQMIYRQNKRLWWVYFVWSNLFFLVHLLLYLVRIDRKFWISRVERELIWPKATSWVRHMNHRTHNHKTGIRSWTEKEAERNITHKNECTLNCPTTKS